LRIASVAQEQAGHIIEGILHCTNPQCLREFPVIDGIPLLVSNIRSFISGNILALYGREDLSDSLESLLGDCCGQGSAFDTTRQQLSSYAWDHYAELDPAEAKMEPPPGSTLRVLEAGLRLAEGVPAGPILDAGCSVGRGTFALAERGEELVLGVDLNFPMLRLAAKVLRDEVVRYPRRRVGLVYERREFAASFRNSENADFWACDVTALPFPATTFGLATGLNLLDCLHAPREFLLSLERVLKPGGKALLACPYDWSAGATPLEGWVGGHSQRSNIGGSAEARLRLLLTPGAAPSSLKRLRVVVEREHLPWHVRLHDRGTMTYSAHLVLAERPNT
jgi:SAM-dependent methyltransferase